MNARVIEGFCTDCAAWTPLHDGRCGCGSGRVAVPPAGYRILGPDEVDALDRLRDRADAWPLNSDSARVSVRLGDLRALGRKA